MKSSVNYSKTQSSPTPTPTTVDWKSRLFTEDYQQLVNTFNIFDQEGSGVIDPVQINKALTQLGTYQSNPFILKLINGLLQIPEPITLDVFINSIASQVGDFKSRDGVQKIFRQFDVNVNEFISTSEFRVVADKIHECISDAEIDQMVHTVFINWQTSSSNGLIFEQFYNVVTSYTTN